MAFAMPKTIIVIIILISIILMALWIPDQPFQSRVTNHIVPVRTRWLIIEKWENNVKDIPQLSHDYQLAESTIESYIRRYKQTGTILTDYEIKKQNSPDGIVRRRKKIDNNDNFVDTLMDEADEHPTTPLYAYVDIMMAGYGVYMCHETINRFFKRNEYKYKKLSAMALEADPIESAIFWECYEEVVTDIDQCLFLDEAGKNDKTSNPTHGRGAGKVYVKIAFTKGGYKLSYIVVVGAGGLVCYEIVFGSVNEEIFLKFAINKLAKFVQMYPLPRSVIFVDNISFHHCSIFRELIQSLRAILFFLPRYEPLTNLAEKCIRDSKSIEKSKNIYGELDGLLSLTDTLESLKKRNYLPELKEIGYI